MRSVGEQVGKPADVRTFGESNELVDNSTYVGLEIEVENIKQSPDNYSAFLSVKGDGSLRNGGIEVIFAHPLKGQDVVKATREIFVKLRAAGNKPVFSERCGAHVHIDVRPLVPNQLLSVLSNYAIFERSLYKYCGGGRDSNIFCLPYYKAERGGYGLNQFGRTGNVGHLLQYGDKYYGLNVKAVELYGSLEYRMLPGTESEERVIEWINILLALHKWSVSNVTTGADLLKSVSQVGVLDYAKKVFGKIPNFLEFVRAEDMYEGLRYVQGVTAPDSSILYNSLPKKVHERSLVYKFFRNIGVDVPLNAKEDAVEDAGLDMELVKKDRENLRRFEINPAAEIRLAEVEARIAQDEFFQVAPPRPGRR